MKYYLRYVNFASKKPIIIVMLALAFVAAGIPAMHMLVSNAPSDWDPKGSTQLADKKEFIKNFGNDEVMALYLTFPDTASQNYRLNILHNLSDSIAKIHGFEKVFSRYDLAFIHESMGQPYQKKLEKVYFSSINPNGEMLYLKLRKDPNPDQSRPFLLDSLQQIRNHIPPHIRSDLTGAGVIFNEIDRLSTRDSKWLLVSCYILVFFLLWWRLRKVGYLLLCSLLVILALWSAMSMFGWLKIPVNTITMVVPLLFIINFFSFAIHLVTKQSSLVAKYLNKKIPPILVSALTNIIGFGSLMLSKINVIYQFGMLTSFGIMAGLAVLLLVGTPLVVIFIDINERIEKQDWMNKLLDTWYRRLSGKLSALVVLIMLIVMAAGICIFPSIKVDTDSLRFMKPNNKVRMAEEYIEKNFGSANVVDYLVDKNNGKPFYQEDWKLITEIRAKLSDLPFIKSVSAYDMWRPLVDRLKAVDTLKAMQLSAGFLAPDHMHSRLTLELPSGSVKEMQGMLDKSQAEINKVCGASPIVIRPVGYLPVFIAQMNTIVSGMLENLAVALVLILLVMSLFVRDFKIGIITTVITVFPLCGVALLMKLVGISFDVATSVISSVVVGMIADDALHIIWALKKYKEKYGKLNANIIFANSVRKIVHPCTATSIMFAIGFAVLFGSDISTMVNFGILSTAVIVFAWISDFIFFPAVLRLMYPLRLVYPVTGK